MKRTAICLIAATIVVIPILASAQAHTKSPQTKAERWARSIATIIADPHLFQSTPESLAAKFKPIVPNITTNWLNESSAENGIDRMRADFVPSDKTPLKELDIRLPLTDPEHHDLYPLLRAHLAKRITWPGWKMSDGGLAPARKGVMWTKTHTLLSISLDDTGSELQIKATNPDEENRENP
jgi:hypothetical protein